MKNLLLFLLVLASLEAIATVDTENTWLSYQGAGAKLLKEKKLYPKIIEMNVDFLELKETLEESGYKEAEVDRLSEQVESHLKVLRDQVYHLKSAAFIDYVSWQDEITLKSPAGKNDLILTNNVSCAGGALGYENSSHRFFLDACFLYGWSNVGSSSQAITYHQSNVPTYGAKVSPGAGLFVSSIKAEVGFKVPILYNLSKLDRPNQTQFPTFEL